jgi:hypothetical protein
MPFAEVGTALRSAHRLLSPAAQIVGSNREERPADLRAAPAHRMPARRRTGRLPEHALVFRRARAPAGETGSAWKGGWLPVSLRHHRDAMITTRASEAVHQTVSWGDCHDRRAAIAVSKRHVALYRCRTDRGWSTRCPDSRACEEMRDADAEGLSSPLGGKSGSRQRRRQAEASGPISTNA